jgi:hypothetical protein
MENTAGSEDWRMLCELASKEQDSEKFMELIQRVIQALDKRDQKSGGLGTQIETETMLVPLYKEGDLQSSRPNNF